MIHERESADFVFLEYQTHIDSHITIYTFTPSKYLEHCWLCPMLPFHSFFPLSRWKDHPLLGSLWGIWSNLLLFALSCWVSQKVLLMPRAGMHKGSQGLDSVLKLCKSHHYSHAWITTTLHYTISWFDGISPVSLPTQNSEWCFKVS